MRGVILAGGRATRLGPLAAQFSKATVTVGGKPMLVRQVQQLRAAGCQTVTVVSSPWAVEQLQGMIDRAGLPLTRVVVQPEPTGPGGAILAATSDDQSAGTEVIMIMSDTLLDDDELAQLGEDEVLVAQAPATRSWCLRWDGKWRDAVAYPGAWVSVGAYRFASDHMLGRAAALARASVSFGGGTQEIGMAPLLRFYEAARSQPLSVRSTKSWRDVGDVEALTRANRGTFTCRPHHAIDTTTPGLVTKRGGVSDECHAIISAPHTAEHLFPRVYDCDEDSYTMEFVDMPSLAELWLYWPSRPEMWSHVINELVNQLETRLWPGETGVILRRALEMYVYKTRERMQMKVESHGALTLNGEPLPSYSRASEAAERAGWDLAHIRAKGGYVHGDPNFTNVMWSLRTGSFKLLDPRGSWGGVGSLGDTRYDLGKLAYSPEFTAVAHRLFTLERDGDNWFLELWPNRDDEIELLNEALPLSDHERRLLRAHLFLSSAPLHEEPEASALHLLGLRELTSLTEDEP